MKATGRENSPMTSNAPPTISSTPPNHINEKVSGIPRSLAGKPSSYHTRIYVGRDGKLYDYSATKAATGDVYAKGRWKENIKLDHGPGKVTMSFRRPDYVVEFVMATSGGKCRVTTHLSKGAELYNDHSRVSASSCSVFDGNAFSQ